MIELLKIERTLPPSVWYVFWDDNQQSRSITESTITSLNKTICLYEDIDWLRSIKKDPNLTVTSLAKLQTFYEQLEQSYPELLI